MQKYQFGAIVGVLVALVAVSAAKAKVDPGKITDQPDEWFTTDEGKTVVANILTWQTSNGGWWKNYDASLPRGAKEAATTDPAFVPKDDNTDTWHRTATIDNKATVSEMRVLARAYRVTKNEKAKDAFNRGLEFLLKAQYPTSGGWPQRYPLENNYGRMITYNDGAMVNVLDLLRDIAGPKPSPDFAFVPTATKEQCVREFDKGVECILATQVKVNGKLTVWCQQHDPDTLAPAKARAYELPSLCAFESVGILQLLMSLDEPSPRVREAIESGVAWYDTAKIVGKKIEVFDSTEEPGKKDRRLIDDPNSILWARFYDVDTNKPFFCGRDGVKRDTWDDIGRERRTGYQWYNDYGVRVAKTYAAWKEKTGHAAVQ